MGPHQSQPLVEPTWSTDNVQTSLEWQPWKGSIPHGAVQIYNENEKRIEYVAKRGSESGFFCSTLDGYCHFSYRDKEYRALLFHILVNKDNFEILEWKDGSYGSVPEYAVKTKFGKDTYVGKTPYGLGKVDIKNKAFFYPYGGKEYSYKEYQVLTFNRDIIKEEIIDVKYKIDDMQIVMIPPEVISKTIITNNSDKPAKQMTSLSETVREQQSWSSSFSLTAGVCASITAGIPNIASASVGFSVDTTFAFTNKAVQTTSKTSTVSIEHEVPPHHSCTVKMEARKHSADIPFTARLKRTYRNGRKTSTTIAGTYKGVQVVEVRAVVEACISHTNPCTDDDDDK